MSFTPNAGFAYSGLAPKTRRRDGADRVLLMAIVGLFCCGLALGPIAAIKASGMLKEMDAQPHVTWTNRGTIRAALVIGIVATAFSIAGIVYMAATWRDRSALR